MNKWEELKQSALPISTVALNAQTLVTPVSNRCTVVAALELYSELKAL